MPGATTGLFGKLPAHGDFVRRGLPRGFVAAWDDWLSAGIAASRDGLGPEGEAAWQAAWEAAPAWRFRLAPGACGPDAAVGVMVTSADTVGRRFPLTLVAVTPDAGPTPGEAWFAALEEAAAQGRAGALDADAVLALLPPPPPEDPDATLDGRSLFWTAGGAPVRMPMAADFLALLGAVPEPAAPPGDILPDAADIPDPAPHGEADAPQAPGSDFGPIPDDTPHHWAETVDLPWATPPAPRNPEDGADA